MTDKLEKKAAETEEINAAAEKTEGKKKKKSRKRKIVKRLIWTLVILLVVGVAVWSIYSKLRSEYKITYDPYTATTGSISNSLSFSGSMQLINSASYTATSDGKVKEIYVAEGDKGQHAENGNNNALKFRSFPDCRDGVGFRIHQRSPAVQIPA